MSTTGNSCTPGPQHKCPSPSLPGSQSSTGLITVDSPSPSTGGSSIPYYGLETSSASSPSTPISAPPSLSSNPTSSSTPTVDAATSSPNAGAIAGGVIGGVIFLVCIALGVLLYLRFRKRKRTAPSSEFMNSLRAGDMPVLRLDSGAEYTPALPEKGGYSHYSSPTPLPFMQNPYYTSPLMESMKFPDALMMSDIPSSRPSVEKPLRPQRYSDHPTNDSCIDKGHHLSASIGSRRELWSSDAEITSGDFPARQSLGQGHETIEFVPRYSMDEPPESRPFSATPQDSQAALNKVADQSSPRVVSLSLQPLRRKEST